MENTNYIPDQKNSAQINRLFHDIISVAQAHSINIELPDNRPPTSKSIKSLADKTTQNLEKIKIISSDLCSVFAGIGLTLMVLENEFIINNVYKQACIIFESTIIIVSRNFL